MKKSKFIKGIEWTGDRLSYANHDIKGDTYPMTWADDDEIYTSSGDPLWGETTSGLDVEKFSGGPTDYVITKISPMNDYTGWGGDGPKPSGMICVDGILYLAFQNMLRAKRPAYGVASQHGNDAHIVYSTNKGQWFIPSFPNIKEPMFPGNFFGGPAFINFGKNNANARDNYVYAVSGNQWDNGSNLRLGRVPKDRICDTAAWEFVCAWQASGEPFWSPNLAGAIPIFSQHRQVSIPEMVYLAGINRYLLLTWRLHEDFIPNGTDLFIYESPEPWGPFSLAHYEQFWEDRDTPKDAVRVAPYCPRIPLKWVDSDGVNLWMQFSGSWSREGIQTGRYRSHVRPFKLILK